MKSRRGVGGLISMIGLVVVFGIVGIAFLSLNTQQTSLFATQQKVNELQHDRNTESFTAKVLQCQKNGTHAKFIQLRVNNTSSQSMNLNSIILYNTAYQNVTDSNYFNGTKIHILSQESKIFDLTDLRYHLPNLVPSDYVQRIIMTTDFGNKIILDYDFTGCNLVV